MGQAVSLTWDEHVTLKLRLDEGRAIGTIPPAATVTKDNLLQIMEDAAAVFDEQNVPAEGSWIVFYVWRGRRGDRTNKDCIRRRLDKKRNPFTWHLRHKERTT